MEEETQKELEEVIKLTNYQTYTGSYGLLLVWRLTLKVDVKNAVKVFQ